MDSVPILVRTNDTKQTTNAVHMSTDTGERERQDKAGVRERERDSQTAAAVEAIKNLSNAAFYTFAKQT